MTQWLDSVMTGSTGAVPPRFIVGDRVSVLRASRLPKVEESIGQGVVTRVTGDFPNQLYWIDGFAVARDAQQLRLILRGDGRA
jgi:hypothetical protein